MSTSNTRLSLAVLAVVQVLCFVGFQIAPAMSQNYQQPAVPVQPVPNSYGYANVQSEAQQPVGEGGTQYRLPARAANAAPFTWPAPSPSDLVVTTGPTVEGYKITHYRGLVEGVAVKEPTGMQDLAASLQGMFAGGQIDAYGQTCEQSRVQAYNNLMRRARGMGANAVIAVRFDNESISMGKGNFATAVVCYGTAVVIEPVQGTVK
jgi:uncharacterized protein YbjQ (UPF0145 family)